MRSEQITARALAAIGNDRYKLAVLVSKRAEQLSKGAEPLIEAAKEMKPVDLALHEIAAGKVNLDILEERSY
ncbi:MAG: DNA-directed RNA polymerase subunit omega [Campylobacteraceae bacterium]|jgi:DNA-directed RNA polymerase subunit omega|nr:DNA-directed RNA polymerase subunit omega [Campylobacteraceae bacterium]